MFTGLIQTIGKLVSGRPTPEGCTRLLVESSLGRLDLGESIAIDGACMTVADQEADRFAVDVMPESLKQTTLGHLEAGDRVNLERALRVGDRLGGHLVSGHVDALVRVREIPRVGEDHRLVLEPPAELMRFVARKGSVTLAGVSLTVSSVSRNSFEVALIPVTISATTLGRLQVDDSVNLEVDLVARYLDTLTSRANSEDESNE